MSGSTATIARHDMAMCEDYPCCGHTPNDPCGSEGATAEDYINGWYAIQDRLGDLDLDTLDNYWETT